MARKHIITIAGKPGSGKSSTADQLAELLNYSRFSSGSMMRDLAKKKKLTLSKLNQLAETDPSIDNAIDEELQKLRDAEDIIIDSRIAFHWIPESFKVYLELDLEVSIARIYKDRSLSEKRRETEDETGVDETMSEIQTRIDNERARYLKLYKIDPFDSRPFDLIVDTSRHSPHTVALVIFDTYRKWLKTKRWEQVKTSVPIKYSMKNQY